MGATLVQYNSKVTAGYSAGMVGGINDYHSVAGSCVALDPINKQNQVLILCACESSSSRPLQDSFGVVPFGIYQGATTPFASIVGDPGLDYFLSRLSGPGIPSGSAWGCLDDGFSAVTLRNSPAAYTASTGRPQRPVGTVLAGDVPYFKGYDSTGTPIYMHMLLVGLEANETVDIYGNANTFFWFAANLANSNGTLRNGQVWTSSIWVGEFSGLNFSINKANVYGTRTGPNGEISVVCPGLNLPAIAQFAFTIYGQPWINGSQAGMMTSQPSGVLSMSNGHAGGAGTDYQQYVPLGAKNVITSSPGADRVYTWTHSGFQGAPQMCIGFTCQDPPPPPALRYRGLKSLTVPPAVGSLLNNQPAIVSDRPNNLTIAQTRGDNNVWMTTFRRANNPNAVTSTVLGGTQGPWTNIGPGSTIGAASSPAICSLTADWYDVFVIGTNGNLYHRRKPTGANWQPWENLGGGCLKGSVPAAIAFAPPSPNYTMWNDALNRSETVPGFGGHVMVFVIAGDNSLWMREYKNNSGGSDVFPTGWGPWIALGLGGALYGIAASAHYDFPSGSVGPKESLDLYWVDSSSRAMKHRAWNWQYGITNGTLAQRPSGSWMGIDNLGGYCNGAPAVAGCSGVSGGALGGGFTDVFVKGGDNLMWQNHYQGYTQYGNPFPAGWWGWHRTPLNTPDPAYHNGVGGGACTGYQGLDWPSYLYPDWNLALCDTSSNYQLWLQEYS